MVELEELQSTSLKSDRSERIRTQCKTLRDYSWLLLNFISSFLATTVCGLFVTHRAADVRACRGYKMLVRERTFLFALSSPLRPPTFTLVVSSLISSLISRGPRLTLKQTRTTVPFAALWQRGIPRLEKVHALRPISRLLSLSFCF